MNRTSLPLLLSLLLLTHCTQTVSPTLYRSAEDLRTSSPSLLRDTYKQLVELARNESEDIGIDIGGETFFLRASPGANFPAIYQTIPTGGESLFLDIHQTLSSLPLASLEGVQIHPDKRRVLLLVRPAPELKRILIIVDTAKGDMQSLDIDDIAHAQWLGKDMLGITTNRNGIPALLFTSHCSPECTKPKLVYEEQDKSAALSLSHQPDHPYAFLLSHSPERSKLFAFLVDNDPLIGLQILSEALPPSLLGVPFKKGFMTLERDARGQKYYALYRTASDLSPPESLPLFSLPEEATPVDLQNQNGNILLTYRVKTETKLAVFRHNSHKGEVLSTPPSCFPRPAHSSDNALHILRYWCGSYFAPSLLYSYDLLRKVHRPLARPLNQSPFLSKTVLVDESLPLTLLTSPNSRTPLPTLLIAYGAYGTTLEPHYEPWIVSLLKNHFQIALAHVRGGGYYGQSWHEQGRGKNKKNSIDDLLKAARYLQNDPKTSKLFLYGKSAGGLLAASTMQDSPELFGGVILDAPLLDVRRAVTDTTLLLTAREQYEWGNPLLDPHIDEAMRNYSPLETAPRGILPPVFMRVGEFDRLTPKEDVFRWISHTLKHQGNSSYLRIVPGGTHGGANNSFDQLEEDALIITFLLNQNRSPG
ncbi:MAG: prolyl oligopeptidase family serine peptidase [Bdellovibrionales bacterium]|nr:prolyl oligopeptidase family serine peptidase [Bdellovibrionales bacterium]